MALTRLLKFFIIIFFVPGWSQPSPTLEEVGSESEAAGGKSEVLTRLLKFFIIIFFVPGWSQPSPTLEEAGSESEVEIVK
jgi:hypothetical protein